MKPPSQFLMTFHMIDAKQLYRELDKLTEAGRVIAAVQRTSNFFDPDMNRMVVADWLIVYS